MRPAAGAIAGAVVGQPFSAGSRRARSWVCGLTAITSTAPWRRVGRRPPAKTGGRPGRPIPGPPEGHGIGNRRPNRAGAQQIMPAGRVLPLRLRPGVELALQVIVVVGQPGVAHHRLHRGSRRAAALAHLEADQQPSSGRLAGASSSPRPSTRSARPTTEVTAAPAEQSAATGAPPLSAGLQSLPPRDQSFNDTIAGGRAFESPGPGSRLSAL